MIKFTINKQNGTEKITVLRPRGMGIERIKYKSFKIDDIDAALDYAESLPFEYLANCPRLVWNHSIKVNHDILRTKNLCFAR
jgi:hypothetical protein